MGPAAGVQALSGTNVILSDDDAPTDAPPTEATGTDASNIGAVPPSSIPD